MRKTAYKRNSFLDMCFTRRFSLNWETVICFLLIAAAILSRFLGLGDRSESHDGSMHAYFSWKLYAGEGYIHSPMLHGPFLYHFTAFIYFLFGVSDYTSRISVAIFGVALVAIPFLMRKWLGRIGAIVASALILISPTILHYSRHLRHDVFAAVWATLLVIAIFKYLEERKDKWLYLGSAATALMFSTKEVSFIYAAIFGTFLVGVSIMRSGLRRKRLIKLPSFDLSIVLGTLCLPLLSPLLVLVLNFLWQRLFHQPFVDFQIFTDFQRVTRALQSEPVVIIRLVLAFFAVLGASGAIGLLWDKRRWLTSAAIFYLIFILLHTTFFTNGGGLATGTMGSLGYWLAQHGVRRGGQPWYYYIFVLLPLYEFLPFLFGLVGIVYYVGRTAKGLFVPFLVYWVILTLVIYSWAGEKMPWIVTHIALPLIILTGRLSEDLLRGVDWREIFRRGGAFFAILLPIFVFAFIPLLTIKPFQGTSLEQLRSTMQWLASFAIGAFLMVTLIRCIKSLGAISSARVVFSTVFVALFLLTIRFSWMANYINYDTAKEFIFYAHGSPDPKMVVDEIKEISRRLYGDEKIIKIAYDNESTWPFEWYFREFPNKVFYGSQPTKEALDAPVVLVGPPNDSKVKPFLGDRYHWFKRRLIWWPAQDYYMGMTLRKLIEDLRNPEKRAELWDIVFYRKYKRPLSDWYHRDEFYFCVRKDVASQLWDFAIGPAPVVEVPEEPYAEGKIEVSAILSWGKQGGRDGEFRDPRGIAIDRKGNVYVVDSGNHRIQKFDSDGEFVTKWGGQGNAPGQFQEPWGIAVDDEGYIYVADTWNHRVQKFDSDGNFVLQWGTYGTTGGVAEGFEGIFWGPRDIAIDDDGNVYVTDTGNKRVQIFSPEGEFLGQWGGFGVLDGEMDEPVGIDIDEEGYIYIADTWNQRVQKFDEEFVFVKKWQIHGWYGQSVVNKPYIAVEGGRVYVTDPEGYRVIVFDSDGNFLLTFGNYGFDKKSFGLPIGIALDDAGNIYVVDSGNHRVMKFGRVR